MSFSDFVKKYHPIVHPERISTLNKKKRSKSYSGYSRGDKVRFKLSLNYFSTGLQQSTILVGYVIRVYRDNIYVSTYSPTADYSDYQIYSDEILEVLE